MAARFHSPELQWQLIRENHSFLVKRSGHTFSSEPCNLTNQHSFKFSGIANPKAVGVALTADRKNVVLSVRNGKKTQRPASSVRSQQLRKNAHAGKSQGARIIKNNTAASYIRPDLTNFAIHRYHALRKSTTGVSAKQAARRAARKQKA